MKFGESLFLKTLAAESDGVWKPFVVLDHGYSEGGFGEVFCVVPGTRDPGDTHAYAAKFPILRDRPGEEREKELQRFRHEIEMLRWFNGELSRKTSQDKIAYLPLPHLIASGSCRNGEVDVPFYVMEWLEPLDLEELKTDVDRVQFACGLCDAVAFLHDNGYVHYDIKPVNIMRRRRTDSEFEYVLSDFGSVHKVEQDGIRNIVDCTQSELLDGRRVFPHTPGYADPLDDLHTVNGDIYAIGQVLRDMFAETVSPLWADVIFRCVSRNRAYRYNKVGQIRDAVKKLAKDGPSMMTKYLSEVLSFSGLSFNLAMKSQLCVDATAPEGGDGSQARPFRDIATAIATAAPDTVVNVAPGKYQGPLTWNKKILLVSTAGAGKTEIRGMGPSSVILLRRGAESSLIKGFTITGGRGDPQPSSYGFDYYGGGIRSFANAYIRECVIEGNGCGEPRTSSCTFGGGVMVAGATVVVTDCVVRHNFAWACGGGMMVENAGEEPGTLVVDRCLVAANESTPFMGGNKGGIAVTGSSTVLVSHSVVRGNSGDQVGGFGVFASQLDRKGDFGARAQIVYSYIEGGASAKDVPFFLPSTTNVDDETEVRADWDLASVCQGVRK